MSSLYFIRMLLRSANPPAACVILFIIQLTANAGDDVRFNRDVRPILSANCFPCHGNDEAHREANLRLDTFEGAVESGAVVPHSPEDSELLVRVSASDADLVMPPPHTEQQLTQKQVSILRQWILQGVAYEGHWAWAPLSAASAEQGPDEAADAAGIDRLLAAAWTDAGVIPADEADPRTLLRRLSYDLRGLPPTPDDVRRFESDPSPSALGQIRDRWMQEREFAEHQAVQWLDLVRWADSSGFVSDEPIASGPYREWVIRAFSENLPFDRFSKYQLAGDLYENPTDEQFVASGYNRLVNTNCEAGAIEEEQVYKLKNEHVTALGTVWLGLTTNCAECHDHKFDPLTSEDYYRLASFFDDLVEAGVYTPGDRREPLHYIHDSPVSRDADRRLQSEVRSLIREVQSAEILPAEFARRQQAARQRLADRRNREDFCWIPVLPPAARVIEGDFEITQIDGRSARLHSGTESGLNRVHVAELMTGYIFEDRQKTDAEADAWYVDVRIDYRDRPELIGIQISHGDYGRLGWRTANYETYYWGTDSTGVLSRKYSWSDPDRVKRMGDIPAESGWVRLRVPLSQRIRPESGQSFEAVGMAWLTYGGKAAWGDSGLELRSDKAAALQMAETAIRTWWETPKNRQVYERRADFPATAVRADESSRDADQAAMVRRMFLEAAAPERMRQLRVLESSLFTLRKSAAPALVSRRAETRRVTRVLNRGDYQDTSGPVVRPAFPQFLRPDGISDDSELTRADLADWLFREASPLTARVFVNRLWQQFYGRGISESTDDSGTQGDWPSHPELLDLLAAEFRRSGWDRNHMIRLLTSTRAYRLSSRPSPQLQSVDPGNRLHARQARFRISAEAVRDFALAASGLLTKSESGSSGRLFPYQPAEYWTRSDKVMFGSRHMDWDPSSGPAQYRRSLYTFWKRQNVHPMLLAFDAPTRQECTARRNITNTPGQALALLNDPIFVEAARALAQSILSTTSDGTNDAVRAETDRQRIRRAFAVTLQREPSAAEAQILLSLLEDQRHHFSAHPDAAGELLQVGRHPISPAADPIETAAWTIVCRSLLNTHEFLTRS